MRKKMLAAALLPLPFAAIPLFAVTFGGTAGHNDDLAFERAPVFEVAPDGNVIRVNPALAEDASLTYSGSERKDGCLDVDGGI